MEGQFSSTGMNWGNWMDTAAVFETLQTEGIRPRGLRLDYVSRLK